MPAQPPTLRVTRSPAAINLDSTELHLTDVISIINGGSVSAQTTLAALQAFFGISPFVLSGARVITSNAELPMTDVDSALLIDKTIAGATNVALITPFLGRMLLIKDKKGDAGANNITLDAGAGMLINGLQTLVMNGNWATTWLIGMSATQWGTVV